MSRVVTSQRVATLVGEFPRSPAYLGLAESLRVLIGDGRIGIDVRLPSERDLTAALDVSRTTVTRAYEVLRAIYLTRRYGTADRPELGFSLSRLAQVVAANRASGAEAHARKLVSG